MIENKIAEVGDATCQGCTQNWEGECRAFSFAHSNEESASRKANNSKMNCFRRGEVYLEEIVNPEPTEDECMTIGMLTGGGMSDDKIVLCLIGMGNSKGWSEQALEYVRNLNAETERIVDVIRSQ